MAYCDRHKCLLLICWSWARQQMTGAEQVPHLTQYTFCAPRLVPCRPRDQLSVRKDTSDRNHEAKDVDRWSAWLVRVSAGRMGASSALMRFWRRCATRSATGFLSQTTPTRLSASSTNCGTTRTSIRSTTGASSSAGTSGEAFPNRITRRSRRSNRFSSRRFQARRTPSGRTPHHRPRRRDRLPRRDGRRNLPALRASAQSPAIAPPAPPRASP